MSIATSPPSTPVTRHSNGTDIPDAEADRRWNAWQARGIAHDRAARRRFNRIAIVVCAIALGAVIFYTLFGSWS